MKSFALRISIYCVAAVLAGFTTEAQTTWSYISTNAFPNLVFSNPVCITSPPGETNRLFIIEKHGRIIVITNLANPTRTIFMDISSRIHVGNSSESSDLNGEEGLVGLAFHPGYLTNRYFYVFYTRTNSSNGRDDTLSRFEISENDTNQGDPTSELRLFSQFDEANNHNAGDIHFGADGYLYVALGDEGGGNDQYANSQRIDKDFFSAIMRIDVDKKTGNLPPNPHASLLSQTNYFVPIDNSWVGATNFNGLTVNSNQVRTEFWAVGMRNPWRWSFDPATGELYLGHVGQGAMEWIDIVTQGANCGWNYFEGDIAGPGGSPPANFSYTHPLTEYTHSNGRNCIIGGTVYRGSRWPQISGTYFYADYSTGEIWALRHDGTNLLQNSVMIVDSGAHISCFGVDPSNGDPLYAALRSGNNSLIKRIVATNSVPFINSVQLSGTNLIVSGTNGLPGTNYFVLTSTNVSSPLTHWTRAATNPFDTSGNFIFTNPLDSSKSNLFYRLQLQ